MGIHLKRRKNVEDLQKTWANALNHPTAARFEQLVQVIVDAYASESEFREHIKNRSVRVRERTGAKFDLERFDATGARAYIADEIGFASWEELIAAAANGGAERPIIFRYAVAAMGRGDFSALELAVGGAAKFDETVIGWYEDGWFEGFRETLEEVLSAACMLGHVRSAAFLVDEGVDPYAGMRSWLAGPHYAVSSGRLDVVKMLLEKNVLMEVENRYGGTMLGQALWSARFEHVDTHAEIVEALVKAGAIVSPGILEWWSEQAVPDSRTKARIANVLQAHKEFHEKLEAVVGRVTAARATDAASDLADALRDVGNIQRRYPPLRDAANAAYAEAADIYLGLDRPLDAAWVMRHIGINHEYAERLDEAERSYDGALALYREFATPDDPNYANAVRYPAVIKNRLGKRDESEALWREAVDRYEQLGIVDGVVEGNLHLVNFAIDRADISEAIATFEKAKTAAEGSGDSGTHQFVAEVGERIEKFNG